MLLLLLLLFYNNVDVNVHKHRMETDMNHIDDEVRKYSVIVGFLLIAIFVVPCISLALLAKCFQKQSNSARRVCSIIIIVETLIRGHLGL